MTDQVNIAADDMQRDLAEAFRANAMLVSMSITRFPLQVSDANAAMSAEAAANSRRGAVKAVKNRLFTADGAWKEVSKALNLAYAEHREATTEWGVGGSARLLPNVRWAAYVKAVGQAQQAVAVAKQKFMDSYDADVEKAKLALGKLAPLTYPSKEAAAAMFTLDVDFAPIAERVAPRGLPEGAQDWLAERYAKRTADNADTAMQDVLRRAFEHASTLYDNIKEDRKFRTSSLENVTGLVPMLRAFNFTQDEGFEQLARIIQSNLGHYTLKTLKADGKQALPAVREIIEHLATLGIDGSAAEVDDEE